MQTDLQQAKTNLGVTLGHLAAELGVTDTTVGRWLAREVAVPPRHVKPLARLLKIDPMDVLPPEDAA